MRKVLIFLFKGTGLTDGRGLLWWHPLIMLFTVFIIFSMIFKGIVDTAKEVYKEIVYRNKWRTKL